MISSLSKRTVSALLIGLLLVPSAFGVVSVPRAHAQIATVEVNPAVLGALTAMAASSAVSATSEVSQLTISNILNGIAWAVAKAAIQSMTKSIVVWINSGFNGSPAFEQNLNASLRKLGDTYAQSFLTQLAKDPAIHSPFMDDLVTNVGTAYYLYTGRDALKEQLRYTLNKSAADDKAFLKGDFSQGGWDSYFAAFSNPANNPYGAQMLASRALADRISTGVNQRVEELSWGSGFLSWRGDCVKDTDGTDAVALAEIDSCQSYSIQTPGSVTENMLVNVLGSPVRQLELADSINEIVGALAQQLVAQVIGGTGLRNVSEPSQGGGSSYLSRATDASQYTSNTSSLSTGFISTLTTTLKQVQQYRTNWITLQTAANAAKTSCASNSQKLADPIQTTLDAATTAIGKADAAIAALNLLIARANTLTSSASADAATLSGITADYQNYTTSSEYPTAAEISNASIQVTESSASSNESLITTLNKLALPNCGSQVR